MFVGIDCLDNDRINKIISNEKFLNKYFTDYEINYASKTINKSMRLAGIFCAKEAFLKAIEIGITGDIPLKEIEVKHKKSGSPYLVLSNNAQKLVNSLNISEIKVSISHTGNLSLAICVLL